jgi:hypothetical protein
VAHRRSVPCGLRDQALSWRGPPLARPYRDPALSVTWSVPGSLGQWCGGKVCRCTPDSRCTPRLEAALVRNRAPAQDNQDPKANSLHLNIYKSTEVIVGSIIPFNLYVGSKGIRRGPAEPARLVPVTPGDGTCGQRVIFPALSSFRLPNHDDKADQIVVAATVVPPVTAGWGSVGHP